MDGDDDGFGLIKTPRMTIWSSHCHLLRTLDSRDWMEGLGGLWWFPGALEAERHLKLFHSVVGSLGKVEEDVVLESGEWSVNEGIEEWNGI